MYVWLQTLEIQQTANITHSTQQNAEESDTEKQRASLKQRETEMEMETEWVDMDGQRRRQKQLRITRRCGSFYRDTLEYTRTAVSRMIGLSVATETVCGSFCWF